MKKKKHSKKDIIRFLITGSLSLCIIAGSVFKYIDKDISSVFLTIFNSYVIICIIGLCLVILMLLFFSGHIRKSLPMILIVLIPMALMIIPIITKMI